MGLSLFIAPPALAATDCESPGLTSVENVNCAVNAINPNEGEDSQKTIGEIIRAVINVLSLVVGVACLIVILIQGLRLILSGNNKDTVKEVRNGIIYALVGLIIALLAQAIVQLVIDKVL